MLINQKNPRTRFQKVFDSVICFCRKFQFAIQDRILLWWGRRIWKPKENPLISIIIPTRNRWDLLRFRAIPSIINQTYKNWGVIIVHDGKPNIRFKEWAEFNTVLLQQEDKIKFYFIEKNFHYPKNAWCRWCAGPVRALNFALSKVKGDYILRMDDDDILLPNALQDLLNAIRYNKVELLSAGHKFGRWGSQTANPYRMREKLIGGIQATLMRSYLKRFKYNPDCWRKKWNSPNDLDLIDRMLRAGVKTAYCCFTVCVIKPRPGQTEIGWKAQQKEYQNAAAV